MGNPIGLAVQLTHSEPALKSNSLPQVLYLMPFVAGLKYWSDDAYSDHPARSYAYYAGIYALLQICGLISLFLFDIAIFVVSVKKAGASVHHDALRTLIRAPLRFFTATDTGAVINLFSQDLNLVDTELPNALLNTIVFVSLLELDTN